MRAAEMLGFPRAILSSRPVNQEKGRAILMFDANVNVYGFDRWLMRIAV